MITPLLRQTLEPIVARQRLLRWFRWSAAWLWALAAIVLAAHVAQIPISELLVFTAAGLVIWLSLRRANRWEPDYSTIAREIETRHPDLHALLLTAVEQEPDRATGKLGYLQQRVVAEATAKAREQNWVQTAPQWKTSAYLGAGLVALTALFLSTPIARPKSKWSENVAAKKNGVEVTPGDAEIERGSGLVVLATFGRDVPGEATLVVQPQNAPEQRLPLVKNLDDPVFGGGLPEVDGDLTYRVEYAGVATRDFTVRVFEHPRLDRADATLRFPEYTKLAEKQVPDTRRISAVEGASLDVAFQLNKPVKSAKLVGKDGAEIPLAIEAGKASAALRDFTVKASQNYELRLEDADGRASKVPAQFAIEALPNRRPELKFATPKGDQRVTPIQEIAFRGEAWDDFGLARYGLTINVAGRGETDHELGRESSTDERRELAHLLPLEQLGVKQDELVSWFLWAEDVGPDGKPRRTATDMFFAEVRPFEEIYRPGDDQEGGEQQQQQGGGAGGAATKLAELQKQIITATWNIQRAEDGAPKSPTEKYLKDTPVVRDSQAEALEMATALGEEVEEPKSQALVENVTKEMQSALERLTAAATTPAPLPEALAAEQSAYNALLKLAAHEFRVSKSRQQSQSGQQAGQQQQQLDELEMKEEKKRYETKREAEPMQNEQQREQLAILNRLKELAQRQQDINEKLKELQTALQEAKTAAEEEEIKRQLKRLREEEQQLLADVDETRQKMEQSPQQSQLAEERRKLDETRSEAQQAAEAMEKNEASQALASGTRAARKLEEMREDFRKKTSGRFNEEMRDMRADARELAQQQQEIAEKLKPEDPGKTRQRTLDGRGEREQLAQQLEKQRGALGEISEEMKRVSEQAEAAEPLLAKELYDTLRKTAQAGTGETLERTQLLTERGYGAQAQKFEEKARAEIEELKSGVERAAESVLGDEAEALRQARAELDALTEQLNREIAEARPDLAEPSGSALVPRDPGDQVVENQERTAGRGSPGSALVPSVGEGVPLSRTSTDAQASTSSSDSEKVRPGETPQPTSGTGALPGERPRRDARSGGNSAAGEERNRAEANGQRSPSQEATGPGQEPSPSPQVSAPQRGGETGQPGDGQPGGDGAPSQKQDGAPGEGQPGSGAAELLAQAQRRRGGGDRGGSGGGPTDGEEAGPLTGERFVEWSDRLRNVEEMLDDPALRTEAARVREAAKGVRAEFKRHSVAPNWDLVKTTIGAPLAELRDRLSEELARRESKENLVPIDRDPVPTKYAERVRRYYEELGRSSK